MAVNSYSVCGALGGFKVKSQTLRRMAFGLVSTFCCIPTVWAPSAGAAIFGEDNRRALTSSSALYSLGRATAIAVLSTNRVLKGDGTLDLNVDRLSQLCSSERFFNEPSVSYACTGFLIAPDLLVTAGHCVYALNNPNNELKNETGLACPIFDWLFDYASSGTGAVTLIGISQSHLYHCKQIVYAVQQEHSPFADFALIQLDRPVADRTPLALAGHPPDLGAPVFMIGFPYGTPLKLTDHARVTFTNPVASAFVTNLDAFEGNSGSPVFNSQNEVTGILVGGTPSANTYYDTKNKCERFNRCDDNAKNCTLPDVDTSIFPEFQAVGSDVQRIEAIVKVIPNFVFAEISSQPNGVSKAMSAVEH